MNKELLERGVDVQNAPEENNYQRYLKLGGIINETDYNSALSKLKEAEMEQEVPDKHQIAQVENMVDFAGIELKIWKPVYQAVKLYSILRSDVRPEGVKNHHDQMNDQRIFVEVLRMLGDVESVDKMIKAYPNISFEYQRGDDK